MNWSFTSRNIRTHSHALLDKNTVLHLHRAFTTTLLLFVLAAEESSVQLMGGD